MAARRKRSSRDNPYRGPDAKTVAARAAGYPARSVFKLEAIDKRVRLLKQGQRVLDLGAAPGSWSLYASKRVGKPGLVVAIDLSPIAQAMSPNVVVVRGDGRTHPVVEAYAPYDVVVSDMAPATTGSRPADQYRSFELCLAAIEIAKRVTVVGGSFVGKIFMSEDYVHAKNALEEGFRVVRTMKPDSVRKNSLEVFLVGLERREDGIARDALVGLPRAGEVDLAALAGGDDEP